MPRQPGPGGSSPEQARMAQHSMPRLAGRSGQRTASTPPRGSRTTTALPLACPAAPKWMCAMVSPWMPVDQMGCDTSSDMEAGRPRKRKCREAARGAAPQPGAAGSWITPIRFLCMKLNAGSQAPAHR